MFCHRCWRGWCECPPAGPDSAPGGVPWSQRLRGLPRAEQDRLALDLVRSNAADVLGHATPEHVETERGFLEMGFDSLTAVELRNRLNAATGLRMSTTLIFDYPTPATLAAHLRAEAAPNGGDTAGDGFDEARIRRVLAAVPLSRLREAGLFDTLLRLADRDAPEAPVAKSAEAIDAMDAEDLVKIALGDVES